jgi:hypothetical protein
LGNFKEAKAQAIDLPEEDPAIFHFIIAFLYENRFVPLKTAASALGTLPYTKRRIFSCMEAHLW